MDQDGERDDGDAEVLADGIVNPQHHIGERIEDELIHMVASLSAGGIRRRLLR
jgi:hypothetical protein